MSSGLPEGGRHSGSAGPRAIGVAFPVLPSLSAAVLLAQTRFVLKPDFDPLAFRQMAYVGLERAGEISPIKSGTSF